MRVVVVAYHFPPDPAVGSIRARKVVDAFCRAGHDVEIITVAGQRRDAHVPFRVREVKLTTHPREIWRRWSLRWSKAKAPTAKPRSTEAGYTVPRKITRWKRYLFSLMWLPDDRQGFIGPAYREARRAVRDGADIVYTTAPPFSSHLVGLLLKRRSAVPWVAEFRDPWMDGPGKPPQVRSRVADKTEHWLETRCLAAADQVVAVTRSAADLLTARMPADSDGCLTILNGIDDLAPMAPATRAKLPRRIVYMGNLYLKRDPRPFLRALAELMTDDRSLRETVRVEFYGSCEFYDGVPLRSMTENLGLGDVVTTHAPVPHRDAKRIMAEADVLLLFAQRQPMQIPNKLYEYLATRRPILAFADEQGETTSMLDRTGGHFRATGADPVQARGALAAALRAASSPAKVDEGVLREWSSVEQMRRLVEEVENRFGKPGQRAQPALQ